jgi:hypothetical protein
VPAKSGYNEELEGFAIVLLKFMAPEPAPAKDVPASEAYPLTAVPPRAEAPPTAPAPPINVGYREGV